MFGIIYTPNNDGASLGSGADPSRTAIAPHTATLSRHSVLPPSVTSEEVKAQNVAAERSAANLFLLRKFSTKALQEADAAIGAVEVQLNHSSEMMKKEEKVQQLRSKHGKQVARFDFNRTLAHEGYQAYTQNITQAQAVVDAAFR